MLRVSLGLDTSNYKTSVAAVDEEGNILCNLQQYLDVKKGERGLRQSVALFQHVNNLPALIERAFETLRNAGEEIKVDCIAVSDRPRSVRGSYMPCFQAGLSTGLSLAAAFGVPCLRFSHQEGHIEAVRFGSPMEQAPRFLSFHFSGGTTEALVVSETAGQPMKAELSGGSKDIAFGQVLDRVGVALGMEFPCGQEMDQIAVAHVPAAPKDNPLPKIKCRDGWINLSGIETSCQRLAGKLAKEDLVYLVFVRLAEAIEDMSRQLAALYDTKEILFAGGVSASAFIRTYLKQALPDLHIWFGAPSLSTDNAVGTALLGGKKVWR